MGTFLCDVDGVLADIDTPVKAIMGEYFVPTSWNWGKHLAPKAVSAQVDNAMNSPGFCNSLEHYPGAVEFIRAVQRKHTVVFVTSPNKTGPTWMWERQCWLAERWPDVPVCHLSEKQHVSGDWLLEDKYANAKAWGLARSGLALLLDRPYNRAGLTDGFNILRVFSYDHVLQTVGCL